MLFTVVEIIKHTGEAATSDTLKASCNQLNDPFCSENH
jgi:hypothetical protein